MAATIYGDISYGMSAETGMFVESADFDTNIESVWIPDEQGADVAGATFNAAGTFTLSGFLSTVSPFSALTGAAVTIANEITWSDVIDGTPGAGATLIVESVKNTLNHKNAEALEVSGIYKPWLEA